MVRIPPPGSPQVTPAARRAPEKFGRYMLMDRIGSGGMAEVFRAVTFGQEGFRRVIVIKRIRRELSDSPNFLTMFFDEAKISALLHHPNIVHVYDFGQVDGAYFLAMEHVDGRDLSSVLRALRGEGRLFPPSLVAYIGQGIASALNYAHTLVSADGRPFDIIHRDINPSNVMLVRTGGVKVLDFGIAKASEAAGKTQTQRAMLKGKLSYLSPEQARLEPLDARSDLFSWGSTVWELLTGHRLFGGQADFERLNAVKHAQVIPPSERRPEIPAALNRIVMRTLERDLEQRYQSAGELLSDLEAYLKRFPPEPDGVKNLLGDLFGDESTRNLSLPTPEQTSAALERAAATEQTDEPDTPLDDDAHFSLARGGAVAESDTAETEDGLPPEGAQRRPLALWTVTAALGVAVLAGLLWSVLTGPVAPPVLPTPSLASPEKAKTPSTGTAPSEMVEIDVDSEPRGATVYGSHGALGITPMTVRLPASAESEQLRFEKDGYATAFYDVRPRSAGAVFVELRRKN